MSSLYEVYCPGLLFQIANIQKNKVLLAKKLKSAASLLDPIDMKVTEGESILLLQWEEEYNGERFERVCEVGYTKVHTNLETYILPDLVNIVYSYIEISQIEISP